jgi:hypothetical protein
VTGRRAGEAAQATWRRAGARGFENAGRGAARGRDRHPAAKIEKLKTERRLLKWER